MSGEQKTEYVTCSTCDGYGKITSEQQEIENLQTQIQIDAAINYANIQTENAALKTSLAELTDFTESLVAMHAHAYAFADAEFEKMAAESKAIIDRAKKLLNKQPQSESDGDKNLS